MTKYRIIALLLLVFVIFVSFFVYSSERGGILGHFPFKLGLDLAGGTELVYKANVDKLSGGDINNSMNSLRDVIERRINIFGVSEPIVQVEEASALAGREEHRLIIELPSVTDVEAAIALIGKTPLLEFRLMRDDAEEILKNNPNTPAGEIFLETGLTGRLLEKSQLDFDPTVGEPIVNLSFNKEGKELFADITSKNRGKILAIFLDGEPISTPVIRDEIRDGKAQISGQFSPEEARVLVRDLNFGALPVPVSLIGTQTIGASLGEAALAAGVRAGIWGSILVAIFLILWYRLPGLVASVSLIMYVALSLTIFKLIPVTLTAAGLAGFILSIGMAVDANILIFERMREELLRGRMLADAMKEGFKRAWLSIRDSNISSIITAIVLFWLGTSSVKGFALTFGIGVLVSMFTAISASRMFLYAVGSAGAVGSKGAGEIGTSETGAARKFLFGSGIGMGEKVAAGEAGQNSFNTKK